MRQMKTCSAVCLPVAKIVLLQHNPYCFYGSRGVLILKII